MSAPSWKSLIPDRIRQWPGYTAARAVASVRNWRTARRQDRALKVHLEADRRIVAEGRAAWEASPDPRRDADPLVSVVIPTWNRGDLVAGRSVPLALAQTHRRLEVIVVGDCCTDDTAERLARIRDPRLCFVNRPTRGPYPANPMDLWRVAGVPPANEGLARARGDWIAPLDDDEEFLPDHVERLLKAAREADAEFICGQTDVEKEPGQWKILAPHFDRMILSHSAVMFRGYLRAFKFDIDCWRCGMPVDQHTWRRMQRAGVRMTTLDAVVGRAPLRPGNTRSFHQAEDRRTYATGTSAAPGATPAAQP